MAQEQIAGQLDLLDAIAEEYAASAQRHMQQSVSWTEIDVADLIARVVRYGFAGAIDDVLTDTDEGMYGEFAREFPIKQQMRIDAIRLAATL